jgi:RNA polymerase sigma-70 factor (ECF subfamily)
LIFLWICGNFFFFAPTLYSDERMKEKFLNEFQEFWKRSAPKVRAYMFCACENTSDADDMAQDCCLRAFRAWNQFNGKASRQAWLFGIARRTRVDWLRKRKRENSTIESRKPGQQSEAVSEEARTNNIEKVWEAVKNLNDEYSEVIHLRFAAGLSYEQIAHTLEIPLGTVRSRLHRGLKAIRENIGERENGS